MLNAMGVHFLAFCVQRLIEAYPPERRHRHHIYAQVVIIFRYVFAQGLTVDVKAVLSDGLPFTAYVSTLFNFNRNIEGCTSTWVEARFSRLPLLYGLFGDFRLVPRSRWRHTWKPHVAGIPKWYDMYATHAWNGYGTFLSPKFHFHFNESMSRVLIYRFLVSFLLRIGDFSFYSLYIFGSIICATSRQIYGYRSLRACVNVFCEAITFLQNKWVFRKFALSLLHLSMYFLIFRNGFVKTE